MTPQEDFSTIFSAYTPKVQEVGWAARALIFDVLPQTVEVPWLQQKVIGYGTGPKKMTEHFSWIAPAKAHITFGFYYGAELPDPDGLLEGTGKLLRHAKLRSLADVEQPALRAVLQIAITHRVPPPRESGNR